MLATRGQAPTGGLSAPPARLPPPPSQAPGHVQSPPPGMDLGSADAKPGLQRMLSVDRKPFWNPWPICETSPFHPFRATNFMPAPLYTGIVIRSRWAIRAAFEKWVLISANVAGKP